MIILQIIFACVSIVSLVCSLLLITSNIRRASVIDGNKNFSGVLKSKEETNSILKGRFICFFGGLGWFFLLIGGIESFLWFITEDWGDNESTRFDIAVLIGVPITCCFISAVLDLDNDWEQLQQLRNEYWELQKEVELKNNTQ